MKTAYQMMKPVAKRLIEAYMTDFTEIDADLMRKRKGRWIWIARKCGTHLLDLDKAQESEATWEFFHYLIHYYSQPATAQRHELYEVCNKPGNHSMRKLTQEKAVALLGRKPKVKPLRHCQ